MLVHGARSALRAGSLADVPDDLRTWALAIKHRRGFNVAAVALANKLARVCWRVWHDQRPFERREAAQISQSSCTAKTSMAHRSDRRGDAPITNASASGTGNR
jgi:hypothetical protein